MYRDELLDLYKNPRNEGRLENGYSAESENPSCGDETEVFVKLEDSKITNIKHQTDGCAICTAATSIVTTKARDMDVEEVRGLDRDWMLDQLGVEISPMRMKCAILGLKTLQSALEEVRD